MSKQQETPSTINRVNPNDPQSKFECSWNPLLVGSRRTMFADAVRVGITLLRVVDNMFPQGFLYGYTQTIHGQAWVGIPE